MRRYLKLTLLKKYLTYINKWQTQLTLIIKLLQYLLNCSTIGSVSDAVEK